MKQLEFKVRRWGGKRRGAGRKGRGGVPHRARPALAARFPVHVTVRMEPHVWNLRSRRSFRIIGAAIAAASRFDTRICELSVQGNHLHLIVESANAEQLSRAVKGLNVRMARGLNTLMARRGRVVADRYHTHILRTPTEVRRAVHCVRHNHRTHVIRRGDRLDSAHIDPCSSAARTPLVAAPTTAGISAETSARGAEARGGGG